ncbi:origin recognition complex subunit 3 [Stomoxys calcitrans]|uniref:origin recognition complex subunit 3 n=1 Tax=Stomoxys calcitrans TaxID=35570 RepID=UPI0027E39EFA|nr:origin recognition complex subunit 3 [Stomoxys calcitrans]
MDPTISVSKGCFVFKNGATRADKTKKSTKRKKASANNTSILGKEITDQPFYAVYAETWSKIQRHIETLQKESSAKTLQDLVDYVVKQSKFEESYLGLDEIVPAAALLTGINQPDHLEQFDNLSQRISERISASICVLQSRDCSSLKAAVETLVYNFIESPQEDDEDRDNKRLRKSHCTMKQLKSWYRNNWPMLRRNKVSKKDQNEEDSSSESEESQSTVSSTANGGDESRHMLIVILPDFECFNSAILQDLILILSSNCTDLPFVLILGIATSIASVHNALPYHVTSKIKLKVFQTQSAPVGLNEILEKVILSPRYAFHLSGKAFKFLTHIFLYYDFSINGFIQGFKYCFMEHFFQGNAYSLCCNYSSSLTKIKAMTHEDMEVIRKQLSFRPYVEGINDCKRIIAILTDDNYLKKKLPSLLRDCHVYFMTLRIFLEFLTVLVEDLPKCPLGKFRRELYATCMAKDICSLPEFRECWKVLAFMSKNEFVAKISRAIKATQEFCNQEVKAELELAEDCEQIVMEKLHQVKELLTNVVMAGTESIKTKDQAKASSPDELKQLSSRQDLKDKLMQMSKQQKPVSDFSKSVHETLDYIEKHIVAMHLGPLQKAPALHELFVFSDISTVRRNIIGAPRAALHMALNNPHFYLQCKCCPLREHSQLLATLPDISVMYKLHLECGRMINLYDWLQAFRSVVDFTEDDQEQIDPQIQARFTRAVAELQFLGYIKMSKRKTDHATRLTW